MTNDGGLTIRAFIYLRKAYFDNSNPKHKMHVHPEHMNLTLVGNRVFADVMNENEVILG